MYDLDFNPEPERDEPSERDLDIEDRAALAADGLHRCPDGVVRPSHPSFDCPVCEGMQTDAWYEEMNRRDERRAEFQRQEAALVHDLTQGRGGVPCFDFNPEA